MPRREVYPVGKVVDEPATLAGTMGSGNEPRLSFDEASYGPLG